MSAAVHDRFTCMRCGKSFVCERPTSNDSSWNRYALHTYDCEGRGRGYERYEYDAIVVGPFSPISAQPVWSPYDGGPR